MKRLATIALLISAGVIIAIFTYLLFGPIVMLDYSKVTVTRSSDREYLTEEVIRRTTDSALSDLNVKLFLARFNSPDMRALIQCISSEDVHIFKYGNGDVRQGYDALPDSSPVLLISFHPRGIINTPEDTTPTLLVFLEPETYRIYKSDQIS